MNRNFTNLPKTGFSSDSPKSFILNAGAIVKDLIWTGVNWTGTRLGATAGGNTLTLSQEIEQIEVDGVFASAVGLDIYTEGEASLTCNVKELTAENIRLAIIGETRESNGVQYPQGYTVIETKGRIEMSDYLINIAYVGTVAGSNQPIIVILKNAICTSGLELEQVDGEAGVVAMTFEGRADGADVENMALPVTILYPNINLSSVVAQNCVDEAAKANAQLGKDKKGVK